MQTRAMPRMSSWVEVDLLMICTDDAAVLLKPKPLELLNLTCASMKNDVHYKRKNIWKLYGFEKLWDHFQEKFQLNDSIFSLLLQNELHILFTP